MGERTSWSVPSWVHTRADSTADMVTYRQPLRDKRNACYTTTRSLHPLPPHQSPLPRSPTSASSHHPVSQPRQSRSRVSTADPLAGRRTGGLDGRGLSASWRHPRRAHEEKRQAQLRRLDPQSNRPAGGLLFNVLAMMAEFEFDLIRARIRKEGRSRNAVSPWARNLLVNGVGARLTSPAAACCLEGADFSPNSAVVGLRMRPAHWCSLAPVYAISVNKRK